MGELSDQKAPAEGVIVTLAALHPRRILGEVHGVAFRLTWTGFSELMDAAEGVTKKDFLQGPAGRRFKAPYSPSQTVLFLEEEEARWWFAFSSALAGAERSPRWAETWLKTRSLPPPWSLAFLERAEAEGFLNAKRYAARKLQAAQTRGGDPLWILKRKISAEGGEVANETLKTFDETKALLALIERRYPREQDPAKLMSRLRLRGFSAGLIRRAMQIRFGSAPLPEPEMEGTDPTP